MPEKQPIVWELFNQWASLAYVVVLSSMTGAIGYMNKIRRRWHDFSWFHLTLAFFTGGLNGYFVFLLCDAGELSWQSTAFLTGAAGAMGTELLNALLNQARQTLNLKGENDYGNREIKTETER